MDPQSLDDDFAQWTPGIIDTQMGGDVTEEDHKPASSGVVVNVDTVHCRVRYLSSVCMSAFHLYRTF